MTLWLYTETSAPDVAGPFATFDQAPTRPCGNTPASVSGRSSTGKAWAGSTRT